MFVTCGCVSFRGKGVLEVGTSSDGEVMHELGSLSVIILRDLFGKMADGLDVVCSAGILEQSMGLGTE